MIFNPSAWVKTQDLIYLFKNANNIGKDILDNDMDLSL